MAGAIAQSGTAAQAEAATEAADSQQAQTIRKLLAIKQALEQKRERVRELVAQMNDGDEIDQEKIRAQITELRTTIDELTRSFETIAVNGASLRNLDDQPQQQLSWHDELMQIARPLLNSLKEATAKPRRIEELRREIDLYKQQLEVTRKATASLAKFDREKAPPEVVEGLAEIETAWIERARDIQRSLDIASGELGSLEAEKIDLLETFTDIAHEFFLGRGLTLLIALLTGVGVWLALRALRRVVNSKRQDGQDTDQAARMRLLSYAYQLMTMLLVALAILSVFYVRGDLLLLSLAIIALIMLVLGIWRYLPRYVEEGRLLLNVGAAREGERVVYRGLPFRVTSLNLYSELRNPELKGVIRLPLAAMAGLISRPRTDEAWFPCRVGDYLLLADGSFAQVLHQGVDSVRLKVMGSILQIDTAEFVKQQPRNLSIEGFGIAVTFGIDYQHQAIALQQVPQRLHEGISAAFAQAEYGDDLKNLLVEFKSAGASSLDYLVYASMGGSSAESYFAIGRLIQQACVDTCNREGWVIPFTQVTVHQADSSPGNANPGDSLQPA